MNSPLPNIFYTIGGNITGASVTGLPAGVTGTYNAGSFLITNTPSEVGVFNYTITTSGGPCGQATATGTITVDTVPTLVHNNPGSEIQSLCEGTSLIGITYTFGGSATGVTVSGLPSGVIGSVAGSSFTIAGSPTQSGIFNFTVSTTGSGCGQIDLTGTITVDGNPLLTLVSAAQSDSQNVCFNSPIDSIIYLLTGTSTDTTVAGLPLGISSTIQGDSIIIMGSPSVLGTFSFTVFTAGGLCPPDTVFGEIAIGNPPVLTLVSAAGSDAQALCGSSGIDSIIYTISGAADTAFSIGLPTGVTQVFSGDSLIITGSPSAFGTFNFTAEAQGGLCANDVLSGSIDVFDPTISLVSALTTVNQQLCINTPIDSIVYVFSGGATGATTLNLPTGLSTNIQNDSLVITGTPTVAGLYGYAVITTGTSCDADSSFGVIDIQASPTITLVSVAGTDSQTVDEDEAISQIVYLVTGSVSGLGSFGLPAGVSSTVSGDSLIITGSTSTFGVYQYAVGAVGTLCSVDSVTGVLIVIEVQDTVVPAPPNPIDTTEIFVPNLFSPNGDDLNDTWEILQLDQFTNTEVMILNREGQVVFEDKDYQNTWDGTYNGDPLPEATYYYRLNIDDGEIILKGAVSILRNDK